MMKRIGSILIVLGLLVLLYPLGTDLFTYLQQSSQKKNWKKIESKVSRKGDSKKKSDASYYREVDLRAAFARIVIPKIDVDAVVHEGTSPASLRNGPGHMRGTGLPGENGNCVISGHRTTYGHPFHDLHKLSRGDEIELHTPSGQVFVYRVTEKRVVRPTDMSVTKKTKDATLTLTTCNPFYSARERLVIIAKLK